MNSSTFRLLHLHSNPVVWRMQERMQELENVKTENQNLKQRIEALAEWGSNVDDLTMLVEERMKEATPVTDANGLHEQFEAKKKWLMDAFKGLSSEYRDITYILTGYRIEIPCNGQYRLSSMYAESPEDYILFSKSEDGCLHLLETPFSASLRDKIHLYLHTQNSIPAFLSHITIDLFNSQTAMLSTVLEPTLNEAQ